ncbi:SPAG5 isoform 11, partial [Pongo abelii]
QEQDLEKTQQYSQKLGVLTEQLQSLTLFLQTKLKEKTMFQESRNIAFFGLPAVCTKQ